MIQEKLNNIKKQVSENVTVVAVSKTKPEISIMDAYKSGHLDFGENKVQELCKKYENLPKNIRWHMIGHLQRNKVKFIAPFIYLIHGVDSIRLLNEINKQAKKCNREIDILLQIHIAQELTKYGFSYEEAKEILVEDNKFENVRIKGFMGMATFTNNTNQIISEFNQLNHFYNQWKDEKYLTTLSMGMSNDYNIAIGQGSNMIRIGSLIFGSRS